MWSEWCTLISLKFILSIAFAIIYKLFQIFLYKYKHFSSDWSKKEKWKKILIAAAASHAVSVAAVGFFMY